MSINVETQSLLDMLFDRMPMVLAVLDRSFRLQRLNPTWVDFAARFSPTPREAIVPGAYYFDIFPGSEASIRPLFERVLAGETVRQDAVRLQTNGYLSYWDVVLVPILQDGQIVGILDVGIDATERRRAEHIQAGQQEVLELLATGASLAETLRRLLWVIEAQSPGMLGLILLLDEDGRHLHIGAGPSLPGDYLDTIEGLEIGPQVGSCGTASYTGKRVIVTDIAADPRWDNLRDLALQHNLRACWSEPVLDPEGRVIGTFAMYYQEPRSPTEAELRVIASGANLAGIAIQRSHADEALQESERRLFTLMSNLPGMAYRCRNEPSWPMTFVSRGSLELTGYSPEQLLGAEGITYGALVHPDDTELVWRTVQAALPTRGAFQVTYRIRAASGEEKWVWEQGRGVYDEDGSLLALEGFITDATERVLSRRILEERVKERTRELFTLLQVSQDVASTLEPGLLLEQILDQLKTVVDYEGASVLVLRGDVLEVRAYRGPIALPQALQIRFPLSKAGANRDVIEGREPICISDVYDDSAEARAFRQTAGDGLATTFGYVRSWLGVPLIARGQVVGMLSLDHSRPQYYTKQRSRLALAFANQVAVTMENARLFAELERRTQAQEALYRADEELYSHLEMDKVLQSLVDVAVDLLQADKSSVMVWDQAQEKLVLRAARGFRQETSQQMQFRLGEGIVGRVAASGEAVAVEDVSGDDRVAQRVTGPEHIRSFIHLPLKLNGDVFGVFNVSYLQPRAFDEEDRRLFTALAQRAALAVENARLYRDAERRADETQTLFNVQQAITGNRDQDAILQLIADEACRLTAAQQTVVFMPHDGALEMSVLSGFEDDTLLGYRMPLEDSLSGLSLRLRRPLRAVDAANDERVNQDSARRMGARCLLAVPLLSGERALGAITALNKGPGHMGFDDDDERVLQMLAAGAVIALENARLFEKEQDRRRVAEGLRDMLSVLNANVPLEETLHYIAAQAVRVLDADAGIIFRLDQSQENIVVEAMADIPPHLQSLSAMPLVDSPANRASLQRVPAIVPDLPADMAAQSHLLDTLEPRARAWLEALAAQFGAYLSVPFVVGGRAYGDITLYYRSPRTFSDEEVSLALAFGEQASLVAENAHLRIQTEASAASEERTRLARELHDAVTQTLFSASLIADVLPRIWEKNPEQGRQRLEELRELTRGALAEMRTLLLELRPSTLAESSLPELLRQLREAVVGRSRLDITLQLEGEAQLPPKVTVVFYRVAQEALNNVAKHAAAGQARIDLVCTPQTVTLTIADDGRGFERSQVAPNSLGLSIMRERTAEIGATLSIDSTVGSGTTVRCAWQG